MSRALVRLDPVPPHLFETPQGSYEVRIAQPSDEAALRRMLEAASPEDVRLRFFRYVRTFPHAMVEPLTRADEQRYFAFVAAPAGDRSQLVGSAMLVADPDGGSAEFGIFVAREHRDRRLGRHLLDCLFREARAHGIPKVHGLILTDNAAMVDLAQRYGFSLQPDRDEVGCLRAECAVAGAATQ